MTQYLAEIRVTLEAFITFGVLWWTIRVFALEASRKEGLRHEEDNAHEQLGGLVSSTKKLEEAVGKVRDKLIPSQLTVINQLQTQLANMEQTLESSQLPEKIKLCREVKAFYTKEPETRYFRASDWDPQE